MGATLTLTQVYGNLLIAFAAVFVGIVATATWRVPCLCIHRNYSTRILGTLCITKDRPVGVPEFWVPTNSKDMGN